MTEIRQLKDFPQYAPILAFWAFREWYGNRSIDFNLVMNAYQDRINNDKPPMTWIAIERTMPVGMVTLKTNDLWSRKDLNPWLASLFVLPEYRKRGTGKNLIDVAIKGASYLEHKILYLFIDANNKVLYNYYTRMGWNYVLKTCFP